MRLSLVLSLILLKPALLIAEPSCGPVQGIEQLTRGNALVILGEIHGTDQAPAFAAAVACHALREKRPVILALELPQVEQTKLDRYLSSSGSSTDRDAFLESSFWSRSYQDGRTSEAMIELVEAARKLISSKADLTVIYIDRPEARQNRDQVMADRIIQAAAKSPDSLIITLVGNLHARITPGDKWMGSRLLEPMKSRDIISLNLRHSGGSAWICLSGEPCGVQELGGRGQAGAPQVSLDDAAGPRYSGWFDVGPISASPPAIETTK